MAVYFEEENRGVTWATREQQTLIVGGAEIAISLGISVAYFESALASSKVEADLRWGGPSYESEKQKWYAHFDN